MPGGTAHKLCPSSWSLSVRKELPASLFVHLASENVRVVKKHWVGACNKRLCAHLPCVYDGCVGCSWGPASCHEPGESRGHGAAGGTGPGAGLPRAPAACGTLREAVSFLPRQ